MIDSREAIQFVLDHYNTKIYKTYSKFEKCDFQIHRDYTSDGVMLYVAKDNKIDSETQGVFLSEHVFYHGRDTALILIEEIKKGNKLIYVDETIYEDTLMDNYIEDEYYNLDND
tara:strand:+ start:288 stop:629 length:342 start_codon:yes stop_codon:yes gene_type:complete